jgi:hypothetical protein
MTHYGAKKVILKNKKTGKIEERVVSWYRWTIIHRYFLRSITSP